MVWQYGFVYKSYVCFKIILGDIHMTYEVHVILFNMCYDLDLSSTHKSRNYEYRQCNEIDRSFKIYIDVVLHFKKSYQTFSERWSLKITIIQQIIDKLLYFAVQYYTSVGQWKIWCFILNETDLIKIFNLIQSLLLYKMSENLKSILTVNICNYTCKMNIIRTSLLFLLLLLILANCTFLQL